jgi:hypothetical protein
VRRELLGEELLTLPELVRQNSEDIRALQDVVRQNSEDIRELKASVTELREVVEQLVRVTEAHGQRLDQHSVDLAELKGWSLEERYFANPHRILPMGRLRRVRSFRPQELPALADVDESSPITEEQAGDAILLDMVVSGRAGQGQLAHDEYLAVEVSWTIDEGDVVRAARRAEVLRLAGLPAVAVVAGKVIGERARVAADREEVEVFIEPIGRVSSG